MKKNTEQMLEDEIERAVAPYARMLPPDLLDAIRLELALALGTHPVASRAFERACPPPHVEKSATLASDDASESDDGGALDTGTER